MTVFEPQDALKPIKAFLIDRFADAGAPFDTVRVALNLATTWTAAGAPQLVLFDDGGPGQWPVASNPTVRVTVYSSGRDLSRRIAARAVGLLLCTPIPGIAKVLPGTSIFDTRDQALAAEVASFTVRTRVRTVAV